MKQRDIEVNRRTFVLLAITLPALLQSCIEEAPAQEPPLEHLFSGRFSAEWTREHEEQLLSRIAERQQDLTIGERIQIVDAAIRRCVLPDGWTVEEWNGSGGSHIFELYAFDTLTPAVSGYALSLHWRFNQFGGRVYQIDADSLIRDAHLPSIDQLVSRTLLDAVERFEGEL